MKNTRLLSITLTLAAALLLVTLALAAIGGMPRSLAVRQSCPFKNLLQKMEKKNREKQTHLV